VGQLIKVEIDAPGLSIAKAAEGLGVTRQQLYRVTSGECANSPEMVVRMEKGIGSSAAAWLKMQMNYQRSGMNSVNMIPTEQEITAQGAADLLCVSRPYLVSLIEKGQLHARKVGDQWLLPSKDVLAFRDTEKAKRFAVLDELTALGQELGIE
jgi:addiction module HigA family antidote